MELQTEQALPDGIWDVLIEGGEVIDGSKRPRFRADVGVVGDRIVALGDLQGQSARLRIDALGKIVAPGFIDAHTHDDHAVLCQPDMVFKVSQGVTTVVTGNCGISHADARGPVLARAAEPAGRRQPELSDFPGLCRCAEGPAGRRQRGAHGGPCQSCAC